MKPDHHRPPSGTSQKRDEFPRGASVAPNGVTRRQFLQIMAASLALAGSTGCFRKPREQIHTYLEHPEELIGSETLAYATTLAWRGYGRGLVARSYQGRPIKLDGNPDHHSTLGASDSIMQAAVLDLYDPNRQRAPRRNGQQASWEAFRRELAAQLESRRNAQGKGLWIVAEPNTSPTEQHLWKRFVEVFPRARITFHQPAAALHFPPVDYRFEEADVVLGIGADFLTEHPESLRFARHFSSRRRGWKDGGKSLSRFFSLHSAPNPTTTMADVPCAIDAREWPKIMEAIESGIRSSTTPEESPLPEPTRSWVAEVVSTLQAHVGRSLVLAGSTEPAATHAWAQRVNSTLGNFNLTVHELNRARLTHETLPSSTLGTLDDLAAALGAKAVSSLIIFDANPVFTASHLGLEPLISRAPWSAAGASIPNETTSACQWQLPFHHFLEDWGDLRAFTGESSPVQPLIHPLFDSRSRLECLHWLEAPYDHATAHELMRSYWQDQYNGAALPQAWQTALSRGLFPGDSFSVKPEEGPIPPTSKELPSNSADLSSDDAFTIELRLDPTIEDGRHARNAWLQELPKPLSKIVWDSALWIAPEVADERGWKTGELIDVTADDVTVTLPVFPVPGMASRTAVAFLGYGRPQGFLHEGQHPGFDAFPLWRSESWRRGPAFLNSTGKHHALVSVQHHREMEGHDFVRIREPGKEPHFPPPSDPSRTSLYPVPPEPRGDSSPYQWGMSIDLSSCTGCSACVTACQAENNIPVVGKAQVGQGREMHWLHIDQYFDYSQHHPHILHQPRLCMHCEKAPCELVCPVAATVHDREGLNVMVYNRCIGTRYCSNNCPYKVRCFNFLDYRPSRDDPRNLQFNPEVTVRERGVMEKCTFCVQRISAARIQAKSSNDGIPPDSVRTACQEACPTDAIVFGNIADPQWQVVERKQAEGDYALLGQLDTRPRVSYLPKWRNATT